MDRLAELRRQRSLIEEHLAWLDREIDQVQRESNRSAVPSLTPTDTTAHVLPSTEGIAGSLAPTPAESALDATGLAATPASDVPASDPEILLEKFRAPPDALNRDVRKGCMLYFAGAFVLLGIVVAMLYFTIGSR